MRRKLHSNLFDLFFSFAFGPSNKFNTQNCRSLFVFLFFSIFYKFVSLYIVALHIFHALFLLYFFRLWCTYYAHPVFSYIILVPNYVHFHLLLVSSRTNYGRDAGILHALRGRAQAFH